MGISVEGCNDAAAEIAKSDYPLIRQFEVPSTIAFKPADDIGEAAWKVSGPANTGAFSAVGYYFARKLYQELGIPVGIINTSKGGSNIETWISSEALTAWPEFGMKDLPADAAQFPARYHARMTGLLAKWQPGLPEADGSTSTWKEPGFDDSAWPTLYAPKCWEEQGLEDLDGVVWYRRTIDLTPEQAASEAVLNLGTIDDCDETYLNGRLIGETCVWDTVRSYSVPPGLLKPGRNVVAVRVTDTQLGGGFYGKDDSLTLKLGSGSLPLAGDWKARVESFLAAKQPGFNDLPTLLFNTMLHPITDFPVRGVVWYQGESNVPRAAQYVHAFQRMIADWRQRWAQPRLPFYFVQLASFLPLEMNDINGSIWAELRDAQRQALSLPDTGMVVATDIGDAKDIHPRNKQEVGRRLALHALKNQYGKKINASGPLYRSMRVLDGQIELSFTEVGSGLVAAKGRAALRGFAVADERQKFLPAQARIVGDKVIVSSPGIPNPTAVRYGWVDNPEEGDLFNNDGLPASPFRTDDWPWRTEGKKYQY
jgi:sialate O-acetylesterase